MLWLSGCQGALPQAPIQPMSGPGGSDYPHGSTRIAKYGTGDEAYWIITPSDPVPESAPVVVFLHGWGGMLPVYYGAWIEHIVRRGYTVVFPRYQANLTASVPEMMNAAMTAAKDAYFRLAQDGPVAPDPSGMAWVGHSLGGFMAAALAPKAQTEGLPPPEALMVCHPGNGDRYLPGGGGRTIMLEGLDQLPPDLLVLVVVGDADVIVGTRDANMIVDAYASVTLGALDLVTVQSDRRGVPALVANHFAPLAASGVYASANGLSNWRTRRIVRKRAPDALDYFGYWKLGDGLLDAAFRGVHADYALGGTAQQRYMGSFSDGVAVRPLLVRAIIRSESN